MARFLILNGPNLNMLGQRDAGFYGVKTLDEINGEIRAVAARLGVEVEFFQSNHEGALVDCIQEARDRIDGLIVNGGALTPLRPDSQGRADRLPPALHRSAFEQSAGPRFVAAPFSAVRHRPGPNCRLWMEKLYCGIGNTRRSG